MTIAGVVAMVVDAVGPSFIAHMLSVIAGTILGLVFKFGYPVIRWSLPKLGRLLRKLRFPHFFRRAFNASDWSIRDSREFVLHWAGGCVLLFTGSLRLGVWIAYYFRGVHFDQAHPKGGDHGGRFPCMLMNTFSMINS